MILKISYAIPILLLTYCLQSSLQGTPTEVIIKNWKYGRNMAYIFYAAMFVLAGVASMKKQQTDTNTQPDTIKHLIHGIILTTFSYAIHMLVINLGNLLLIITK